MSKLENEVYIAGTLGRDAEFKTFGSGKTLVKFSINHPKGKKRDDGTWDNIAQWIDVQYWHDDPSDGVNLVKGAMVSIIGSLGVDQWQDSSGNKKTKIFVNASSYTVIDKDAFYGKKSNSGPVSTPQGRFIDDNPNDPNFIPF